MVGLANWLSGRWSKPMATSDCTSVTPQQSSLKLLTVKTLYTLADLAIQANSASTPCSLKPNKASKKIPIDFSKYKISPILHLGCTSINKNSMSTFSNRWKEPSPLLLSFVLHLAGIKSSSRVSLVRGKTKHCVMTFTYARQCSCILPFQLRQQKVKSDTP